MVFYHDARAVILLVPLFQIFSEFLGQRAGARGLTAGKIPPSKIFGNYLPKMSMRSEGLPF